MRSGTRGSLGLPNFGFVRPGRVLTGVVFTLALLGEVSGSGQGSGSGRPRLRVATKILPPFIEWGEGLSLEAGGVAKATARVLEAEPFAAPASAPRGYYWDGRVNVSLVGPHIAPPPSTLRRPTLTGFSREYLSLLFDASRLAAAAEGGRPPETALYEMYSGYDLVLCGSNTEMFQLVDRGLADMAHAGISVTTSRMAQRHFSKSFFPSSISLMVWDDRDLSGSGLAFLQTFVVAFLVQALPVFLLLVFLAANFVWSAEHFFPDTKRSLFAPTYYKGIWQAMEWSGRKLIGDTTLKDVPFGRWAPRAAMFVTGLAVFLQSFLTGAITTGMQGVELQSTIRGLGDLGPKNVPVGSVAGTTSSAWLVEEGSKLGISNVHLFPDYSVALARLQNRSVEALIYDFAPQRHVERLEATRAARLGTPPPYTIVDADIAREKYAVAFGKNASDALRALNLAIVSVEGSPEYDALYARFFAPVDEDTASIAASFLAFDLTWVAALWGVGTMFALVLSIFICYRARLALRLGGCRRSETRPRSMGSRARETLSRTQTFMREFRGRGHEFDERIRELEERAVHEDRYLNDPAAIRQAMGYSREALKKIMGLLNIIDGMERRFEHLRPDGLWDSGAGFPAEAGAAPAAPTDASQRALEAEPLAKGTWTEVQWQPFGCEAPTSRDSLPDEIRVEVRTPARYRSHSFDDLRHMRSPLSRGSSDSHALTRTMSSSSDPAGEVGVRTPGGTEALQPPVAPLEEMLGLPRILDDTRSGVEDVRIEAPPPSEGSPDRNFARSPDKNSTRSPASVVSATASATTVSPSAMTPVSVSASTPVSVSASTPATTPATASLSASASAPT